MQGRSKCTWEHRHVSLSSSEAMMLTFPEQQSFVYTFTYVSGLYVLNEEYGGIARKIHCLHDAIRNYIQFLLILSLNIRRSCENGRN